MRIPPTLGFGNFGVVSSNKTTYRNSSPFSMIEPLQKDVVSFTSNARYVKKYATLPDEIKQILNPKDAVDMFRNIETIARGMQKGTEIGKGRLQSYLYENPWLNDYYILVLKNPDMQTETIYSDVSLDCAVWQDCDDPRIQIVKACQ